MAAKRSRDARRAKETQIAIQATILERENKNLTQELSKARAENLLLRERLQKYEPMQSCDLMTDEFYQPFYHDKIPSVFECATLLQKSD